MFSEVAAIYRVSKKKKDINWFTHHICRPPAAVLVYLLRGTPVTPNQLTLSSLVVCAGAAALFILAPGRLGLIAASAVFLFSFILDCADGMLARLRKQASIVGHLLDFLTDELKAFLVYGAVAVRLWRDTGDLLYLAVGIGGLAALASGISLTSFMRRSEYGAPPPTEDGQPAVVTRRRGPIGLALTLLEHGARFVVHYPQYIWLLAGLERLDIYFWGYGAVNVLYYARSILQVTLKLGRFAAVPARAAAPAAEPPAAEPPAEAPAP